MTINVQFSDAAGTSIIGYFTCHQDAKIWPNMGTVDVFDQRWKDYYDKLSVTFQPLLPSPTGA